MENLPGEGTKAPSLILNGRRMPLCVDSSRLAGEPSLLHGFFERSARLHPHRVAVEIPPGRTVTYADLERRSGAIAARLAAEVGPESLVAILLPRDSAELFAAEPQAASSACSGGV